MTLVFPAITDYSRQTILQKPSRFVTEVPPALYDIWSLEDGNDHLQIDSKTELIN